MSRPAVCRCPRNARFWVWECGGWVKLTLRPGQSLSYAWFRTADEGWDSERVTWSHTGNAVECESDSSGADCDGRLDRSSLVSCPLAELQSDPVEADNSGRSIFRPNWERVSASQRDHFAEAAGY